MGKAYVSNRFPYFSLGSDIRFANGLYVAKNEDEEKLIESHEWFGTHLVARDVEDENKADERRVIESSSDRKSTV